MSAPSDEQDDVYLILKFHYTGRVDVWAREVMPGPELANLLRQAAAGFDDGGTARRIG